MASSTASLSQNWTRINEGDGEYFALKNFQSGGFLVADTETDPETGDIIRRSTFITSMFFKLLLRVMTYQNGFLNYKTVFLSILMPCEAKAS